MDWKIFSATFGAVFLAELADKTQLVSIGMSAKSGKPITVLIASVSAYIIVTIISVYIGSLAGKSIKPEIINFAGGFLFIIIGILMMLKKI
ncbi:MAG: TMEM165/GDT1 family protein [Candidatus Aureabacteria bacterium]|nr:TMEM165/GDT1 family protein [Candidatus Auribacterota bacterium]